LILVDDDSGIFLIGTGVGDPSMMPVKGVELAKECEYRFLEGYTSLLGENGTAKLQKMVGEFEILRRSSIENPSRIIEMAKESKVAILVVGDPLQATTHADLILHAIENNIPYKIVHATSVTTVVSGGLGLQSYKFGRQVTIAFPMGDYLPTSPIEMMCENYENGLHTLVLLDLDPTGSGEVEPTPMTPKEAVEIIQKSVRKLKEDPPEYLVEELLGKDDLGAIIKCIKINNRLQTPVEGWQAILCSNLGTENEQIVYGKLSSISRMGGEGIHCLVIPANMLVNYHLFRGWEARVFTA